jgi:hypothetical protein
LRSKSVHNQAYRRKKNCNPIKDSISFNSNRDFCENNSRTEIENKSKAKLEEVKNSCIDEEDIHFEGKKYHLNFQELLGDKRLSVGKKTKGNRAAHSSFILRLPRSSKLTRDGDTSKSFELPNHEHRDEEGDESLDMTWFKGHISHDRNKGKTRLMILFVLLFIIENKQQFSFSILRVLEFELTSSVLLIETAPFITI